MHPRFQGQAGFLARWSFCAWVFLTVGEWVLALEDPSIYLNEKLATEKNLDFGTVQEVAGQAAMSVAGIAGYFTRSNLLEGRVPATPVARAMQLAFHPERAGDVLLVPRSFSFWGKYGERNEGSTHGSPYRYDSHVPLAFWGAGIKPGTYHEAVDMADVAPTLATLLEIGPPAAADGMALAEVLRKESPPRTPRKRNGPA